MFPSLMNESMTGEKPTPDRRPRSSRASGIAFIRPAPLWST